MKLGSKEAPSKSSRHTLSCRMPFPVKFNKQIFRALLPAAAAGLFALTPAHAAIISTGDIIPSTDPSTWTNGTSGTLAYIGNTSNGALTVNGGSSIAAYRGYIGNNANSSGSVTITGSGSTWTVDREIYNGYGGTGVMNITNGGVVGSRAAYFGYNTGSNGRANVDGSGSALNVLYGLELGYSGNGSLNIANGGNVTASTFRIGYGSGTTGTVNISGNGSKLAVINTPSENAPLNIGYYGNGVISVKNGGTMETSGSFMMGLNTGTSGTVTVDGVGSSWSGIASGGGIDIGQTGNGTLNITNGGTVTSNAYGVSIADNPTVGTVNVDGIGSTWSVTIQNEFFLSRMGTANLNITNGGKVISSADKMHVGYTNNSGGSGNIKVNGPGSSWSHTGTVNLGWKASGGIGRLVIGDGGAVSASSLVIAGPSIVTADLGRGSSLTIGNGTGTLTNDGTIRLVAGAGAANGSYKPISAGTWSGTGTVQALGGIWNSANHTVTVSNAATGAAGAALTADLANTQRFLFIDGSTGKSVGASFNGTTTSSSLSMTASAISTSELSSLQSLVGTGNVVLSGWDFTTSGYTDGNPVYLSLFAASGHGLSDLTIWHYDGSVWGKYAASDLAYDNIYASFTVTGFSGYAVSGTAPVPVPAALWLLGSGVIGLVGIRRRKIAC
jgi:T5SS/PEP-CTERM-associated repeat protein